LPPVGIAGEEYDWRILGIFGAQVDAAYRRGRGPNQPEDCHIQPFAGDDDHKRFWA
jgi:hypothetical protein